MPLIKLALVTTRLVINSLVAFVKVAPSVSQERAGHIHEAITAGVFQWSAGGVREGGNAESSPACRGEVF